MDQKVLEEQLKKLIAGLVSAVAIISVVTVIITVGNNRSQAATTPPSSIEVDSGVNHYSNLLWTFAAESSEDGNTSTSSLDPLLKGDGNWY